MRTTNGPTHLRKAAAWFACAVAFVLLAAPLGAWAAPATAGSVAVLGSISGTVTDGVNPVQDIYITAYVWEDYGDGDGEWWDYTSTYTDAAGDYELTDLEAGTYRIGFRDESGVLAPEYWNDAADLDSADDVAVNGAAVAGKNAALAEASHITGHVSNDGSGIDSAEVIAWRVYTDVDGERQEYVSSAFTDEFGDYDLGGLNAGTYRVEFVESFDWLGEYWNNAPSLEEADDIAVGAQATVPNINADVASAGRITGKVTGGGQPLGTGTVWVLQEQSDSDGTWWDWIAEEYTDMDGTYRVGGLESGNYKLEFGDYEGDYLSEYYNNAETLEEATVVPVVAGSVKTGINADLAEGSHITGKVTHGSAPLEGISVRAWTVTDDNWYDFWVTTEADGTYDISGLEPGTYTVMFYDDAGTYAYEYYDNATTEAGAQDVVVEAEDTTDGINADLASAGHITGKVTNGSSPLEGVHVQAWYYGDGGWDSFDFSAETKQDGTYDLGGLNTGLYRLSFYDAWNGVHIDEVYDDVIFVEDGTDVAVTAGQTTSGINAALSKPGSISGKVTNAGGQPLADIRVDASVKTGTGNVWEVQRTYTAADGTYTLEWLHSGSYSVAFRDRSGLYATEYYDNQPVQGAANPVALAAAQNKTGVNAQLENGATISGHVSADESVAGASAAALAGLGDIRVVAWMDAQALGAGWQETGSGYSYAGEVAEAERNGDAVIAEVSEVGDYTIAGLKAGTYTLQFIDWSGDYAPTFLGGAGYPSGAQTFQVGAGAVVTGKNQTMTAGVGYVPVAGLNRYETAVEASKRAFPSGADTVIIATGANWPDALGGAALAGSVNGPLLLTDPAALPATVEAEVTRLGATSAYILGGTGAVSPAVETKLTGMLGSGNVTRLAGTDRFGTAKAVADKVIALRGGAFDGTAFVATGANFPDALGASPIAAAKGWPILLAPASEAPYVPASVNNAVILGGTGAVSAAVEASLKTALGDTNVSRQGGTDRYATAALVAEFGNNSGLVWDGVGIATGAAFPDALSGGAMLGSLDTVMLLTPTAALAPSAQTALADAKAEIGTVHFIGGTGAVSDAVRTSVAQVLQ